MSAWAEASVITDDVLNGIKAMDLSSKSVIVVTTTYSGYIGQTCHADLTNGFETFEAQFIDQGDGSGVATIYTPYIGSYNVYCDNLSSTLVTLTELGQIYTSTLNAYTLYGFHCDGALTDPAAKITYIEGCANADYAPVQMDFTTGIIDGGDWFDVTIDGNKGIYSNTPFFFPRSCMLTSSGTVSYYLDENDESKKEDGVTASDYNNTGYNGNCMMEWGQNGKIIYTKWVPDAGDATSGSFYVCDQKLDNDFKDYCFRDKNNNQTPHFYTSKYFGSGSSSKMRSISGQSDFVNGTAPNEIAGARANGADIWDTQTLAQWQLINGLLVLMAKSTNTQAVYGTGHSKTTNTAAIGQGTMNGKGMFYGSNNETDGVKVFGMENWWGNLWIRIRGYINANGTIKIKMTRGTYDGSTATDYDTAGSGYISLSNCTPSGTSGGYISEMQFNQYGMFAKVASGSGTTQYCDGLWFNNGQSNYAFVSGDWAYGPLDGALLARLSDAPSYASTALGSRLSCTPLGSA